VSLSTWLRPFLRACVLSLCTAALSARAADTDVLLALEDGALARRLAAELAALGLSSARVDPPDGPRVEVLEWLSRAHGAGCALVVERSAGAARVWLADRFTRKSSTRAFALLGEDDADALIALGAVELMRASLLELAHASPAGQPAPSPAVRALLPAADAPVPTRLGLSAGAALAGSPGGVGAVPLVRVGLELGLTPRVAVGVVGAAPLRLGHVDGRGGSADVLVSPLWLGARVALLPPARHTRLQPALGAGVLALITRARGQSDQLDHAARRARGLSAGPALEASLGIRIGERSQVRIDAQLAFALARTDVTVGGRTAAALGQPWLGLGLALFVAL
jgi:hypothetical protein